MNKDGSQSKFHYSYHQLSLEITVNKFCYRVIIWCAAELLNLKFIKQNSSMVKSTNFTLFLEGKKKKRKTSIRSARGLLWWLTDEESAKQKT